MNKKLEMHAMIDAIENDFINNISTHLNIKNIPTNVQDKMNNRSDDDNIEAKLSFLDLHDFIVILNKNIDILNFSKTEKDFINKELVKIINIRNRVMHPRPLEFSDYPILTYTFNNIPEELKNLKWDNILKIQHMIKNDPDSILLLNFKNYQKNTSIYENLPNPEFDDTSYIGRHKERADIKELILNARRNVVTIKGEGGNGKTATVLKTLYELLDDPKNPFEAIIWVTLKTEHLNDIEFKKIEDSINNFKEMSESIAKKMIEDEKISTIENIINFAKEFNTLLVIDNLETLNTKEISDFIYEFSEYGKILITSRIGLGELEKRYTLETMNEQDAISYFNAILDYYNIKNYLTNIERKRISVEELYCNPLAMKWFARSLNSGLTVDDILNNKADVVSFCMSNVYEKLYKISQNILSTCIIEDRPLTYSTLTFLQGLNMDKEHEIRQAVLQLDSSNFLDSNLLKDGVVGLTPLAKNFLRLNCFPDKDFRNLIVSNRKKLTDLKQEMEVKNIRDKYNPKSLMYFKDRDYLISGWYLIQALTSSSNGDWDLAFKNIEIAKKISPSYFEAYKISAFLMATKKDNKAYIEYELAYKLCKNDDQRATILILWSNYVLSQDNRQEALELIEKAEKIDPNNFHIKLEKVKIITYMGKYEEAQNLLKTINVDDLNTLKYKNIYYTRYADTYRRRAERMEFKYFEGRFPLLKTALELLNLSPKPDFQLTSMKIEVLVQIFYYYYHEETLDLFIDVIKKYESDLFNNTRIGKLHNVVNNKIMLVDNLQKRSLLEVYFTNYILKSKDINDKNKGYVTHMKGNYGFIRNSTYTEGIFFSNSGSRKYRIGDLVIFDIDFNDKGAYAKVKGLA